jgi:hypothetical protein
VNDVAKVLNDAADHMQRVGWTTDDKWPIGLDGQGPCSSIAAVYVAARRDGELYAQALDAFRVHLAADDLVEWNWDQPGPEPVIAALRAAAQSVEQEV